VYRVSDQERGGREKNFREVRIAVPGCAPKRRAGTKTERTKEKNFSLQGKKNIEGPQLILAMVQMPGIAGIRRCWHGFGEHAIGKGETTL